MVYFVASIWMWFDLSSPASDTCSYHQTSMSAAVTSLILERDEERSRLRMLMIRLLISFNG
jgi:hypothetical protein